MTKRKPKPEPRAVTDVPADTDKPVKKGRRQCKGCGAFSTTLLCHQCRIKTSGEATPTTARQLYVKRVLRLARWRCGCGRYASDVVDDKATCRRCSPNIRIGRVEPERALSGDEWQDWLVGRVPG